MLDRPEHGVQTVLKQMDSNRKAEAVLNVKRWGNNIGVRLPAAGAKAAHLRVDQWVRVSVERGRVVITPVAGSEMSFEGRLVLFDIRRHGGEAMSSEPVGAERW